MKDAQALGPYFKKAAALLLIVVLANLTVSCHYYKVKRVHQPPVTQSATLAKQPGKYYILHSGSEAWHLSDIAVSEADQTLSGTLSELSPGHQAYQTGEDHDDRPVTKKGHHHRYKPAHDTPYYEVHIYTAATIEAHTQTATIALKDVQRIDVYDKAIGHTVASYVFSALGIAAAVLVVVAIIALATKSSCPFAYTQDERGTWRFNGELYGGAIYAPLERDDYMPLPGLKPAAGAASIKITNELQERQYTNLANLISVMHPTGTLALLDAEGRAHTIAAPHIPLSTVINGKDDAALLAARDGQSLLFDGGDEEDGTVSNAVLRFAKPDGATQGKLVLRAKNSYWLDYAFGKFTECFGTYYNTFAAQQKRAPAAGQKAWSRAQHIPLSVAIRTGSNWKEVATIETPGPLAARDFVVPVDLSEIKSSELSVRLQCGFMFWEVDYAAIDYTPDTVIQMEEQTPHAAIDESGKDVRRLLVAADAQYLAQLSPGSAATLIYDLPPTVASTQRSVFLHSRGYYEYIRNFRNLPDVAQLLSFKKDGAFTRFSKARYERFGRRKDLLTAAFQTR